MGRSPRIEFEGALLSTEFSAVGATASLTLTIDHPYRALSGTHADQTETKTYTRGGTYAIVYDFGTGGSDGHLKMRQRVLGKRGQAAPIVILIDEPSFFCLSTSHGKKTTS